MNHVIFVTLITVPNSISESLETIVMLILHAKKNGWKFNMFFLLLLVCTGIVKVPLFFACTIVYTCRIANEDTHDT